MSNTTINANNMQKPATVYVKVNGSWRVASKVFIHKKGFWKTFIDIADNTIRLIPKNGYELPMDATEKVPYITKGCTKMSESEWRVNTNDSDFRVKDTSSNYRYNSHLEYAAINSSYLISGQQMFYRCSGLTTVDIINFTAKTMYYMFYQCVKLKNINFEHFNITPTAVNLGYAFSDCQELEYVDLSHLDISNVKTLTSMFSGCSKLKEIKLTGWNTAKVENCISMFKDVLPSCNIYVGPNWTLTEEQCGFQGKFIRQ